MYNSSKAPSPALTRIFLDLTKLKLTKAAINISYPTICPFRNQPFLLVLLFNYLKNNYFFAVKVIFKKKLKFFQDNWLVGRDHNNNFISLI